MGTVVEPADASQLMAALKARHASPLDLALASLQQANRAESAINAFITLDEDGAIASATGLEHESARGDLRSPLHGIPVAVKDLYWTKGIRTTAGSLLHAEFIPDEDAAVVERLRAAGAVIVGKTNLVEFGYSPCDEYHDRYGPTRNPWDLRRFPGASSNGSAAAVAAGIVPLAIGSDTGGSVRTPASFCGLTGYMPTAGLVSRYGQMTLSASMDTVGLLGRTAIDCRSLLEILVGPDSRDPLSIDPRLRFDSQPTFHLSTITFGVLRGFPFADIQPGVGHAVEAALKTLETLGGRVVDVSLPTLEEDVRGALPILAVEASRSHGRAALKHPELLLPTTVQKVLSGLEISERQYQAAKNARRRVRLSLAELLTRVDILVTPTCDTTAPLMSEQGAVLEPPPYLVKGRPSSRIMFNLAGLPALSMPCGFDALGLPVGVQLASLARTDSTLLAVADAYQGATDWHRRIAPVAGSTTPIEYP
jgi:aspartyl-tRNA(Asn)/glutamyl-tRNA(Gln) amidotransferase subunit A